MKEEKFQTDKTWKLGFQQAQGCCLKRSRQRSSERASLDDNIYKTEVSNTFRVAKERTQAELKTATAKSDPLQTVVFGSSRTNEREREKKKNFKKKEKQQG